MLIFQGVNLTCFFCCSLQLGGIPGPLTVEFVKVFLGEGARAIKMKRLSFQWHRGWGDTRNLQLILKFMDAFAGITPFFIQKKTISQPTLCESYIHLQQ